MKLPSFPGRTIRLDVCKNGLDGTKIPHRWSEIHSTSLSSLLIFFSPYLLLSLSLLLPSIRTCLLSDSLSSLLRLASCCLNCLNVQPASHALFLSSASLSSLSLCFLALSSSLSSLVIVLSSTTCSSSLNCSLSLRARSVL
ncbi:hypothetical protein ADUPG1_000437 [Aduncisulcus paluster]|uniref:Uncharacterized protein n=1 Tax=Aduncisulcus paluster TaxID=2918883 RepID=A0ABQ5K886_9EUKA|nr:hypothetical protein ADUPG1_000437 [Aduncisulcus paluster]